MGRVGKRGQLIWSTLIPWIIAAAVLILVTILFFILSGKGEGALDYLKNLFRFGR